MNLYWIGSRYEDIATEKIFAGGVTRYPYEDEGNNISFQTSGYSDYSSFLKTTLSALVNDNSDSRFMFADNRTAYKLSREIFERTVCVPSKSVMDTIGNKGFIRQYVGRYSKVLPSIVIESSIELTYDFIDRIFAHAYAEYVIQDAISEGGWGSYLVNKYDDIHMSTKSNTVLVTPYIKDALTINVHIAVAQSDYRVLPPSVQLSYDKTCFCGSDYIFFRKLSDADKNKIISASTIIAQKLQSIGARGVIGLDYLLKDGETFFLECNYRYQGSSCAMNLGLIENNLPSYFEILMSCYN